MLGSDRVTLTGNLPKDHKSLNVIITCSFTLDIYTLYEFISISRSGRYILRQNHKSLKALYK